MKISMFVKGLTQVVMIPMMIMIGTSAFAATENVCMTAYGGDPNCTAGDAMDELQSSDFVIDIVDPCDGTPGDTTTLDIQLTLNANASERFNVGLRLGSSPSCVVANIPASYTVGSSTDSCGDIPSGVTAGIDLGLITLSCEDTDNDGLLNVPYILSWMQKSEEGTCTDPSDAIPGTTAKCKSSDGFEIPVTVPDEICDGIDNDGDQEVDELFPDTDNDGIADCVDVEECDAIDHDGDGNDYNGFDIPGTACVDGNQNPGTIDSSCTCTCFDTDQDGVCDPDDVCVDDAHATATGGPSTLGDACDSVANSCGQQTAGVVLCDSSCSAVTPDDPDADGDTIADCNDNCPAVANTNQEDADQDTIGDACDLPSCGNGTQEAGEDCDDGDTDSEDGCSASCEIESCGDTITQVGLSEACDDGANGDDTDGCSDTCTLTTNGTCGTLSGTVYDFDNSGDAIGGQSVGLCGVGTPASFQYDATLHQWTRECAGDGGSIATCGADEQRCGDGITNGQEACDDGNGDDADGCMATCTLTPDPVCGNGTQETGEACDDGDTDSEDGCSASCEVELCGDTVTQTGLGEACDDGANGNDTDGCNDNCEITTNGSCGLSGSVYDYDNSGDVFSGNMTGLCLIGTVDSFSYNTTGHTWFRTCQGDGGSIAECGADELRCGDGITNGQEVCDDGNLIEDDGCMTTCTTSPDDPICGNGIQETGEACDDGNSINTDSCTNSCTQASTGGGGGGASSSIKCGNGKIEGSEACDDGNRTNGDGCNSSCQVEDDDQTDDDTDDQGTDSNGGTTPPELLETGPTDGDSDPQTQTPPPSLLETGGDPQNPGPTRPEPLEYIPHEGPAAPSELPKTGADARQLFDNQNQILLSVIMGVLVLIGVTVGHRRIRA